MYRKDEEFYESSEEETDIGYSSTNLISHRISARVDVELEEYTSERIDRLELEVLSTISPDLDTPVISDPRLAYQLAG